MAETTAVDGLIGEQWTLGPAVAEFIPHTEDAAKVLLQVSLAGLGLDIDDLQPTRVAHALRWLHRLNSDVWAEQGWMAGLDENDDLLLLRELNVADVTADTEIHVKPALDRGLELAHLWVELLQAEPASSGAND